MEPAEDEANKVTALFPDPAPFWKDFTPANLARFAALKEEFAAQQGVSPDTITRIPGLPEELINLQPPAEPFDGKWGLYGETQALDDELQSLEDAGIQRLGKASEMDKDGRHLDRAFELKRIAKSMILNFLELIGIMGHDPSHGSEKVQDLKTLLLNFHHILNEYRPHQAREQLVQMMQDHLDSKRAETAAIRGVVDRAKRLIEGLGSMTAPSLEPLDAGARSRGSSAVSARGKASWGVDAIAWRQVDEELS